MLAVGSQHTRLSKAADVPAVVTVVAIDNGTYIVSPVEFGPNLRFTAREMALFYGCEDAEIREESEFDHWRKLSARVLRRGNAAGQRRAREEQELPTPEAVFAREAAKNAKS